MCFYNGSKETRLFVTVKKMAQILKENCYAETKQKLGKRTF